MQTPSIRATFDALYAAADLDHREEVRLWLRRQTRHRVKAATIRDMCTDRELLSAIRYMQRKERQALSR